MDKPSTLPEWKQYLAECLDTSAFMALGSSGSGGAWVNPVYFAYGEDFTLYFISEPSCVHMQNIQNDARVSCAIYSTGQSPQGPVVGVQLVGIAQWVPPEEAERACAAYFTATAGRKYINQANRPEEYTKPDTVWRMAKVTPEHIWVFDEKNFGGSRVQVSPEVFAR